MNLRWNKKHKLRFVRNLPISWIHQTLSGYDKTELIYRLFAELFIYIAVFTLNSNFIENKITNYFFTFIIVHTIFWIFNGQFTVVLVVCFDRLNNGGIKKCNNFLEKLGLEFEKSDSVKAVLVYGSYCRQAFHLRSDLDVRVIRKKGIRNAFISIIIAIYFRFHATLKKVPLDLMIVDSIDFLNKTMREDEFPIIVFKDNDYNPVKLRDSLSFKQIKENPQSIFRSR